MATTVTDTGRAVDGPPTDPWWARLVRVIGWTAMAAGVVVGLFIVYLLVWTDREAAASQAALVEAFDEQVLDARGPDDGGGAAPRDLGDIPVRTRALPDATETPPAISPPGDGYSLLWFERDGAPVVTQEPLVVVQGVTLDRLELGPGHYPTTEEPGQAGNVAFAGHRTTWGKPFHNIDQLRTGDEIHVVDGAGRHWIYDFRKTEIVTPSDVWVVDDEALPGVSHLLTLTSCHPKYSAAQRIVVFAELRRDPSATGSDAQAPSTTDAAPTEPEVTSG